MRRPEMLEVVLPGEVLAAVDGREASAVAVERLAVLGAARLRGDGSGTEGGAGLREVITDALAQELVDRVRLARSRVRLAALGAEVWGLEEESPGRGRPHRR